MNESSRRRDISGRSLGRAFALACALVRSLAHALARALARRGRRLWRRARRAPSRMAWRADNRIEVDALRDLAEQHRRRGIRRHKGGHRGHKHVKGLK